MVQIFFERAAAGGGQAIFRFGHAPVERFGAAEIAGVFQLARVDAQDCRRWRAASCFNSLKVSDSFTASALTMARRVRS